MNETMKKIDELRDSISYTYFKTFLTDEDYEYIKKTKEEIDSLKEQLKGSRFCALKFTNLKTKRTYYITMNKYLCCCDEPTWFDSEEEALEYYDNAELDKSDCEYEFEWRQF